MIKIITMLITALILLLTSCAASYPTSGPVVTFTPNMEVVRVEKYDNDSNADEVAENTQENADESADFKALRESFRAAMESMPRESDLSPTSLEYMLLDYKEGSIILACRINDVPSESDSDSELAQLPSNIMIMNVVANEFTIQDGKLVDKGIVTVPALIKTGLGDNDIEKIFLPEMYDNEQQVEDIKNIFGEYATLVADEVDEDNYIDSLQQLSKIQYTAALDGAFDDFPSKVVTILKSLSDNDFLDSTTRHGAITAYYIQKSFSYNSISIPIWYELVNEDNDTYSTSYVTMCLAELGYGDDEQFTRTGGCSFVNKIDVASSESMFYVKDDYNKYYEIDAGDYQFDYTQHFGEYIEIYNDFSNSGKKDEFYKDTCTNIINSIIDGTFDYTNDSLTYTK